MQPTKECFIITPIGQTNSDVRRMADGVIQAAIIPVLTEMGFAPIVPHEMSAPGSIEKFIIQKILSCDLVIANLTYLNPNVMYELAVRHASGKPVVCIAESSTTLPFDVHSQRTLPYTDDMFGVNELKAKLPGYINDAMTKQPSNPITNAQSDFKIRENGTDFEKTVLDLLGGLSNNIKPQQQEPKNTYKKTRSDGSTTYYICTDREAIEYGLLDRGYQMIVKNNQYLHGTKIDWWQS